jgi:hypothetical protein
MSWHLSGPPILEGEDERELKLAFARYCFENPGLEREAGYHVFPGRDNFGRALQAQAWIHDPIVRAELNAMRGDEDAVDERCPSKADLESEAWDIARNPAVDAKDRIAAIRLAAEMQGAIQKGPAVAIDNRTINVLRVPTRDVTPEDDADFDLKFKAQQTKLVADARSARQIAA